MVNYMQTVIIRPCAEQDIVAITDIYSEAVVHGVATFELKPPSVDEMRRRRASLLANHYPYLVAEQSGRVIGYAYAGEYRSRPAFLGTVEDSIYLAKEARGQGIGKALLEQLVLAAEQSNFRQMVAVIGDSANLASINLHASQGFKLIGTLQAVGWKHGRWLDTVLMQKPLGSADLTPY